MLNKITDSTNNERLTGVETEIKGFHEQFRSFSSQLEKLGDTLEKIQTSVASGNRMNVTNVIAGLAFVVVLWAAFVKPINDDQDRQMKTQGDLARAVLVQDDKVRSVEIFEAKFQSEHAMLESKVDNILVHGSPATQQRLNLVEYRLEEIKPTPASNPKP